MRKGRTILLFLTIIIPFAVGGLLVAAPKPEAEQTAISVSPEVVKWGFMAAALSAGLAAAGAAYAVAVPWTAAMAAASASTKASR